MRSRIVPTTSYDDGMEWNECVFQIVQIMEQIK